MSKILILWEMDPAIMPKDPAERMAVIGKLAEITKKAMDSGKVKDWGIYAGGWAGYSIADETSAETFTRAMMFIPYVKLTVHPVLSLPEVMKVMQSLPK
jgi:muconolactone delta-isomerase